MPAHPRLSRKRERRALALIERGVTLAEAARAVAVSRQTVYRHAQADPFFAVELRAARVASIYQRGDGGVAAFDWRAAAAHLKATDPTRWSLPGGDPFA